MRIYIVQSKLISTDMACVPSVFTDNREALKYAQTLYNIPQVYTDVRICSLHVPYYTEKMSSVTIEVESSF